jgi:TonB family protein
MSALPAPVQRAKLRIGAIPSAARIKIFKVNANNQEALITDAPQSVMEVEQGTYTIRGSLDGYMDEDKVVTLQPGSDEKVELLLHPFPTPPPAEVIPPPAPVHPGAPEPTVISKVDPVYPQKAVAAHIEGIVQLTATITKEGDVTNIRILSGHPLLAQAAKNAFLHWRYRPALVNGQPVAATLPVKFKFRLEMQK